MNVVDSSAWLEYFAGGNNADYFADAIEAVDQLIVPTISLFEVFKRVLILRGEANALQVAALMRQGRLVDLTPSLALNAAKLSAQLKLPMADSIMLATAQAHDALFWTQDVDFAGIAGVNYRPK